MNLYALADKKRTFVKTLLEADITVDEMQSWIAFYEIQREEIDKKMER